MLRLANVVGARPNLMKIAPVIDEIKKRSDRITQVLVHTGQHYDEGMNGSFFKDLNIPDPDVNLGVGSSSHARQTGQIMIQLEEVLESARPDWVVVVGDVNSTMAAALVAAKMGIPIAHIEAGLRSGDRRMPEEINRLVTDAVADLLLTPSTDANANLISEGVAPSKIKLVGNVMIDTLFRSLGRARESPILAMLGIEPNRFCVLTLHRPSNVDARDTLLGVLNAVGIIQQEMPVVFAIHPRTAARIDEHGLGPRVSSMPNLITTQPLGYLDFLQLYSNCRLVLTDSGGIQEETTALGIPCLTLRENTERPITVTQGTNRVVGNDPDRIVAEAMRALRIPPNSGLRPDFWDGHTAPRILDAIEDAGRGRA